VRACPPPFLSSSLSSGLGLHLPPLPPFPLPRIQAALSSKQVVQKVAFLAGSQQIALFSFSFSNKVGILPNCFSSWLTFPFLERSADADPSSRSRSPPLPEKKENPLLLLPTAMFPFSVDENFFASKWPAISPSSFSHWFGFPPHLEGHFPPSCKRA